MSCFVLVNSLVSFPKLLAECEELLEQRLLGLLVQKLVLLLFFLELLSGRLFELKNTLFLKRITLHSRSTQSGSKCLA